MITRTEVEEAIRRTETQAGWSALDKGTRTVSAGDLRVLVEAARCARFCTIDYYSGERLQTPEEFAARGY